MPAIIRPVGPLKKYITGKQVSVKAGVSIRMTLQELKIPSEIIALVLVNDHNQTKDYIIQDNDVIQLVAVFGGG